MNFLEPLLSLPITYFLGWSLLHFFWQGLATAGVLALVLYFLRHHSANARYLVSCGALVLMVLLPGITMGFLRANTIPFRAVIVSNPFTQAGPGGVSISRKYYAGVPEARKISFLQTVKEKAEGFVPWLVPAWIVGVVILSIRFVFGFISAQRVKRTRIQDASESWQKVFKTLLERMKISRPVRLLESCIVRVPMVIGHFKPVVLIPASAMTGLSPDQIEAILAHELAHIRRHDYLVNLVQTVVEILLFYHPAVWWISRRVRWEREHCCDDAAVAICPDRMVYARALVAMEALSVGQLHLAMGANGGSLTSRICRLLRIKTPDSSRPVRSMAGGVVLVLVVSLVAGIHFSYAQPPRLSSTAHTKEPVDYGRITARSTRADILRELGEPECYRWGAKILDENYLPEQYVMCYPRGVEFYFKGDRLMEDRIENTASTLFQNRLPFNTSLKDLVKSIGSSHAMIKDRKNPSAGDALYRDIHIKTGEGSYARVDKYRQYLVNGYKVLTVHDTLERYSSPTDGWGGRQITRTMSNRIASDQPMTFNDKTDYPFIDDPAVLGTWVSIDYVEKIEDFIPTSSFLQAEEMRTPPSDLPLSKLVFGQGGSLSSQGSWTKGLVLDPSNRTAGKYAIKDLEDSTYLFLEWKSNDYTLRSPKPAYLVFKKVN